MIPKEADIYHYFLPDGNPENEVEKYAMTLGDFISLKVGYRPENALLIDKFKYDFSPINTSQFKVWINQNMSNEKTRMDKRYKFIRSRLSALVKSIGL